MKIAYSHIIEFLEENPSIEDVSKNLFQLGHENEIIDNYLDIEFTPNRGDCLSAYGAARDLGVFYSFKKDFEIYDDCIDNLSLNFQNNSVEDCPSISFLNIEIDQPPKEYKQYLNSYFKELSIKKNNFFTDISNYVAYEIGQPTHCYDYPKVGDSIEFINIDKEYEFETLIGKKIKLVNENCIFLANNKPINLAGIMGGKETSCSPNTRNVLIECAYFKPESIISKSVKYDIHSDASYKFERGVDQNMQERALRRFIKIVEDHCSISKIEIFKEEFKSHQFTQIDLDVKSINKILGTNISKEMYINCLERLGFTIKNAKAIVPSFRHDISHENDLAEEVARVIGFDNIEAKEFSAPKKTITKSINKDCLLKDFLIKNGFNEVINMPFCSEQTESSIKVDNPLDKNKIYLRTNLRQSLIENLLFNENRQKESIKLFEISDVYKIDSEINHKKMLSIIISGRVGENYRDFSKKLDIKYLCGIFKKINIHLKEEDFEQISRDNLKSKQKSKIYFLEIEIDKVSGDVFENFNFAEKKQPSFNKYKNISDLPCSVRDISFLLNQEKLIETLQNKLISYKSDNLKKMFIFDFYAKDSQYIKIGYRFIFQSDKCTLTVEQVDNEISKILSLATKIDGINVPGLN